MSVALSVAAFVARLSFFALAAGALLRSIKGDGFQACLLALAASAALMASSALGAGEALRIVPLGLAWAAMATTALLVGKLFPNESGAIAPLPYIVVLLSIGLSLVLDVQLRANPDAATEFARYVGLVVFGLAGYTSAALVAQRGISIMSGHAGRWFALGVGLLAVSLLFGSETNGAKSWLTFLGGLSLQPSEFAKVALTIAASAYLAANASRLAQFCVRGIVPIALAFALSLATVALQKDLGCALVLFATLAAMMASSTKRGWVYLVILLVAGTALVAIAYFGFDHVRTRFGVWLDPLADPYGAGYQYLMAMKCMTNGGIIGCGLGNGVQFAMLPVAESDYIYAVLCEELGLMGCLIALSCYVGLAWTAARWASSLPRSSFERNLVAGVGALVAVEAFLIVGGVTNLIPLTGITLPLVSRGGSSLIALLLALGLMAGASCSGKVQKVASEHAAETRVVRGTVYGSTPSSGPAAKKLRIPGAGITAPHVMALALTIGLAACLGVTAQGQLSEADGPRLCGTTDHRNLRGSIITSDGVTLAADLEAERAGDDSETFVKRVYPLGNLACHVLGERSDGIEAQAELQGTSFVANLLALPEKGDDLQLTLDTRIQAAAEEQISGVTGAIVVLDPKTGRVLAMASSPTFNLDGDLRSATQSYLNRATLGQYSPGSTFKLVTLSAALEKGAASAESVYDAPSLLDYGMGNNVTNFQGSAYGSIDLAQATNLSANTVFAQVGIAVGSDELIESAERFGFNSPLSFCTGAEDPLIGGLDTAFQTAWAACGEPQAGAVLSASPLQMALCMCAIANEGTIMQPYLIEGRVGPLGVLYDKAEQAVLSEAVSAKTAAQVREILQQNGAASALSPYRVWGKTGTAENEGSLDNAWYVCAAEHEDQKVVVACIVEQGGTGAAAAMPRAAAVATAALDAAFAQKDI